MNIKIVWLEVQPPTYGIDTASGTVWAVITYNGYFAAVAGV
ncbi:MAG: hypothetical protein P4L44_01850 [Oryzomonas sp.]|nr:hypothetical protein [Oryzomonas sp.]MDR3578687.1 hypothetical protein [Oryzomonas sp.]